MTRAAWAGLIAVFLLGASVRVGWVAARHGRAPETLAYPDEQAYLLAGRSLAAGNGLIDEFGHRAAYMPAYPAFIAMFERANLPLMALRITQAFLAALVAPATFLLARQWAGILRLPHVDLMALVAGCAAAGDPFLIFFSGLLLTEALFAVALVATWWGGVRLIDPEQAVSVPTTIAVGLGMLACVMLRPSATILIAIVPAVVVCYRSFSCRSILGAAVIAAVVVAGLFPWAARNARGLGEWRWTTTRGGISLYDGLQLGAGGASDLAHTKTDPRAAGLGESAWDAYWRERAIDNLRADPARSLALAGRKFLRTWNIVPNEPEHRRGFAALVSAAWMAGALGTAALGFWRVRDAARWWLALLMPVLAFTALHMIFVGSVRYRIPLMPMLFVLSAVGVLTLAGRWISVEPTTTGGQAREDAKP